MSRPSASPSAMRAIAVSLGLVLALAACGDDDDGAPAGSSAGRDSGAGSGGPDGNQEPDPDASVADASQPAPKCDVVSPTLCAAEPPYADVQTIIEKRCVSCHDGKGEEWALSSQAHVAVWYVEIRAAMMRCTMPPPASGITMPTEERELILQWLRCNF